MEIEREPATQDRRYTGTRPSDSETRMDTDTERRKLTNVCINKSNNKQEATTHGRARFGYNRAGRRTDADACSLQRSKGSRSEELQKAHGRSSKQHEPPQNLHRESYGASERRTESEASGIGPTALRPSARHPPSSSSSSFYRSRRNRSVLNSYLPYLTTPIFLRT